REALRRLAARGLVVQHPGRQARAVALDESLTLENLGLALHDERSEEGRRLLEGFFSLKRQVLVELLADCCANASVMQLQPLEATCYQLWDAARWHPGERCAQLEFELLRLAAQTAARPGHLLLVQSLQRAFRGIAGRLLPFLGGEPLREWAICAMHAVSDRNMQALQHQVPVLLKACDERVLNDFAPASQEDASPEDHRTQEDVLGVAASDAAQVDATDERLSVEERGLGCLAQATEDAEAPGGTPCPPEQARLMEPDSGALLFPAVSEPVPCSPDEASTGGDVTSAALGILSEPPPTTSRVMACEEGGLPRGSQSPHPRPGHDPVSSATTRGESLLGLPQRPASDRVVAALQWAMSGDMTLRRMDHVGIVVDDLAAAIAFFVELGLELEGEAPVEGRWVDRVAGLDSVRADIAMMRTPDGHGRLELTKFHRPTAASAEPNDAPANTLGLRRIMFAVEDIEDVVARLRAHGAELIGELAQYEDSYRLCYVRGPAGIIVALVEQLR
ncbi:VOC family protein, partial [Corallococcus sp. 4LFB]|uniref:VOC family protein n=1 Tax=Corallococcus sp. 4LFB TaxID=3383249 RepID=UPI0039761003